MYKNSHSVTCDISQKNECILNKGVRIIVLGLPLRACHTNISLQEFILCLEPDFFFWGRGVRGIILFFRHKGRRIRYPSSVIFLCKFYKLKISKGDEMGESPPTPPLLPQERKIKIRACIQILAKQIFPN